MKAHDTPRGTRMMWNPSVNAIWARAQGTGSTASTCARAFTDILPASCLPTPTPSGELALAPPGPLARSTRSPTHSGGCAPETPTPSGELALAPPGPLARSTRSPTHSGGCAPETPTPSGELALAPPG